MSVTALGISKHLSDLVGRPVAAKVIDTAQFLPATRTACYVVEPHRGTGVVKVDFHLLATLAGTMIGFPTPEIEAQVRAGVLDENLTDAAREIMNVLSAIIVSEGRAIFKGLFAAASEYSGRAQEVLTGSYGPLHLLVTPAGGKAGSMLIVSDSV